MVITLSVSSGILEALRTCMLEHADELDSRHDTRSVTLTVKLDRHTQRPRAVILTRESSLELD